MKTLIRIEIKLFLPAFAACSPTTEYDADSEHKAEIIPVTGIKDFIDIHVIGEQGNNEGDRRNDAMPETHPESGAVAIGRWYINSGIGTGGTAGKKENTYDNQSYDTQKFPVHETPPDKYLFLQQLY